MVNIKTDLSGVSRKINAICTSDKVGMFVAETFARHMNPFIPMDTGMLAQNFTTEPFRVTYNSPYANRLYEGENFRFNKEKHPLATSHWDAATKSAKGSQISQEITAFISNM